MAFPALILKTGGVLYSSNEGVPDNGNNVITLNIPVDKIDNPDWLELDVIAGPSITNASFVALAVDKTTATINFVQTGVDTAKVIARVWHSAGR